jgi:hypothetical protein
MLKYQTYLWLGVALKTISLVGRDRPINKESRTIKGSDPDSERVFYLFVQSGRVWFANNSDETLDEVICSCGYFTSHEDEAEPGQGEDKVYNKVEPGEAVALVCCVRGSTVIAFI